jgi:3-methyladenine DNA glycosylase AlkC
MPEPFKNLFNKKLIQDMAMHFVRIWPEFDDKAFVATATSDLDALELKERSAQICESMIRFLPDDFERAAKILHTSLAPEDDLVKAVMTSKGIAGWAIMPMTHYIGLKGRDHFELGMSLLKEMTSRFTAEFGIRFFILEKPDDAIRILKIWAKDANKHVRRLVSEGTRPRLPWAMSLPNFIKDPTPILPLLEALKDDEDEYVRRSVANNLNDISKDHPELIAQIAEKWLQGANENRKKLLRHACRTLLKKGHQATLKSFGYATPCVELSKLEILTPRVILGESLVFGIVLNSTSEDFQSLIIDYAIHHRKANGKTTAKVFKWKNTTLQPVVQLQAMRKHAFRPITTRVYYSGIHHLEVFVNGISFGKKSFELIL